MPRLEVSPGVGLLVTLLFWALIVCVADILRPAYWTRSADRESRSFRRKSQLCGVVSDAVEMLGRVRPTKSFYTMKSVVSLERTLIMGP